MKILIVDDSTAMRMIVKKTLRLAGFEGHEISEADDGAKALAAIKNAKPDLVLSDVERPGMDGFTLTRTIRRTRGWEQVPVVIMTSRGDESDRRAGLEAGASAYLLKSDFDQTELVDTVRRLVGR